MILRIVFYEPENTFGQIRTGVLYDNKVIDVNEAYRSFLTYNEASASSADQLVPASVNDYLALGKAAFDRTKEAVSHAIEHQEDSVMLDRNLVTLKAPLKQGAKVICVGKNYRNHVSEMKSEIPDFPVLFAKFSNAMIGPEDQIQKSSKTNKLDYEGELALIIGKEASQVSRDKALDYVAGYTVGNDVSARDLQKRTPQWLQGKTLDHSTPIGPWMVTADEVPDPHDLTIKTTVNGEQRQYSNTRHFIFNIPYLIEFISSLITLQPGDVILTGTPDGVGFAMDPPQFLENGDQIKIEIEKIGILENDVRQ
ncbi:fumarylacetoacetate hydrolase family protein [Salinibacillus aidingensis]|uniref:fumarylacetoacetate hydrolase family protein n=1 Tax=Salinibacillus aidingensis TaxID=237684 RepID=UPI003CD07DA3